MVKTLKVLLQHESDDKSVDKKFQVICRAGNL
jgi:hypothetical protein